MSNIKGKMKKFTVGCMYEPDYSGFDPIIVLRRTEKTVFVANAYTDNIQWRMRIRTDENGNEYVVDSSEPRKWRNVFTYRA